MSPGFRVFGDGHRGQYSRWIAGRIAVTERIAQPLHDLVGASRADLPFLDALIDLGFFRSGPPDRLRDIDGSPTWWTAGRLPRRFRFLAGDFGCRGRFVFPAFRRSVCRASRRGADLPHRQSLEASPAAGVVRRGCRRSAGRPTFRPWFPRRPSIRLSTVTRKSRLVRRRRPQIPEPCHLPS